MLSIGRIGSSRRQQLYYEQHVAKGREDYYAGKGEAPGRWTGKGARLLGLEGELDEKKLAAMMDGKNPLTGEQLVGGRSERSTSGFDFTLSAPKSISVLFALGDEQLQGAVIEAHEEAVDAAIAYFEDRACQVRRGHNGTKAEREAGLARGWEKARAEPGAGFVAAAYRHRMSRAQDPQLHTHVVAANMALGVDGRWTALYAKPAYEHSKAAGSVYQAHLRHAVRERLAWAEWRREHNGLAELEQISAGVIDEFSTRRRQIYERVAELQAAGVVLGDEGRQRVILDTREAKVEVDEHGWRDLIRVRAEEHGLGSKELAELLARPAAAPAVELDEHALAARLFGPAGLTAKQNTFAGQDVVTAVAAAYAQGATAGTVIGMADRMLDSPEVVQIPGAERPLYSTRELLQAERQIVEQAADGRGREAAIVKGEQVELALAELKRPLTDEQAGAVRSIASSGNRIDTVEALAGTGKTTSAAALREVYERAGYRVIGAAPTGRAVRELAERAGIQDSRTLDSWALKLSADPLALRFAELDQLGGVRRVPAVMIVDEAGMAHTRLSAQVIDAAIQARVKVIAIGDSGQLSSVQAGGWLGALTRQHGSHQLVEVMRQRDPRERKGLARLHGGQPDEYLELKIGRQELRVFAGEQPGLDAEASAIERWAAARQEHGAEQAVLICRDNQRRDRLNHVARQLLAEQRELGEIIEIADNEWAVGDRVIARRNDRGRDLDNGMRGTVVDVDEDRGLTVRIDSGQARQLDPEYVAEHLEHAYALTGHGMQGGTVQWAGVIGQVEDFTRNWSYTALSRARQPTQILLIDEPSQSEQTRQEIASANPPRQQTPLERLAQRMRERDDEDLALEQLEHAEPTRHADLDGGEPQRDLDAGAELEHNDHIAEETELDNPASSELDAARGRTLAELAAIDFELEQIRVALADPTIATAREIADLRGRVERIESSALGDLKPRGLRDRGAHKQRAAHRQAQIDKLRVQETELLEHVPDPDSVLRDAEQLREQQGQLIQRSGGLHDMAIRDELARNPPWLHATLGPEPYRLDQRRRWERTAREIASHRLEAGITDPNEIGVSDRDHALTRSISDTRRHLGLDHAAPGHDSGYEL